jgi:hypothetical protein
MNVHQRATPTQDDKATMTLEEARKVLWLRNNCRPLGELLDEGFLDRDKLQWAARWAYNERLRAAAGVLLEHAVMGEAATPVHNKAPAGLDLGMPVEQARQTAWPFRGPKGQPMGALVDAGQLSLKDLAHAIETAWDARVRKAARALLLVRLEQSLRDPEPAAGPLRVVSSGRSYAERRQLQLHAKQGFLMGITLCLLLFLVFLAVAGMLNVWWGPARQLLLQALTTLPGLLGLAIVAVVGSMLGWLLATPLERFLDRSDREIAAFGQGQEGEERVEEALRQALDGNWALFRNVVLPDRGSDLDFVLVGPPGVWVLEAKAYSGEHRNTGERWEYRSGNRWKPHKKSPSQQASKNAGRLSGFLRADGISRWITPAVVWANAGSRLSVDQPSVAVWPIQRLAEELGNLWDKAPMPEAERQQIVDKLTRLCEAERPPT